MTTHRLLAYFVGAAIVAAAFVPALSGAREILLAAGVGLLGLATRWPQDQPPAPPASK